MLIKRKRNWLVWLYCSCSLFFTKNNFLSQELDEELECELQAESDDEEVEYVEADSDLEADLESSSSDIEDVHISTTDKAGHSKLRATNSRGRKQQLEIEYEKETTDKQSK